MIITETTSETNNLYNNLYQKLKESYKRTLMNGVFGPGEPTMLDADSRMNYIKNFDVKSIRILPSSHHRPCDDIHDEIQFPDVVKVFDETIQCVIIGWRLKTDRPNGAWLVILKPDRSISEYNDLYVSEINGQNFKAPRQ